MPLFPHLYNRTINNTYLTGLLEVLNLTYEKFPGTGIAYNESCRQLTRMVIAMAMILSAGD